VRKEMPTVRPLKDADVDAVRSIITSHFADEWSYDVPTNDESAGRYVRVAERDSQLVGVMALSIFNSKAQLRDAMHLIDTVESIPTATRYGFVHAGYVAPSVTGTGVGTQLIARLHEIGESDDVDVFAADAWFHGGADSPAKLLSANGYEVNRKRSIADHTEAPCPKCGHECVCEAALAVRSLSS
jgi:GNAT superfamily N-acetyltransferase